MTLKQTNMAFMQKTTLTEHQHFLPDLCQPKNVLYITLISELLAIILALNNSVTLGEFWSTLSLSSLFILWVSFTCAAIACSLRQTINQWSTMKACLFMLITINLTTLSISWLIYDALPKLELFIKPSTDPVTFYLKNVGISAIVSIILLRFLFIQYQWKLHIKAEAAARLDALQARMRPHFLFNSLNTIASLTRVNPALAETLTENLAELFRATMQTNHRLVPLQQEMDLVQQYLLIEQSRLGHRLTTDIDLSNIPNDALVPPLSIQPLVENAIYHGIEPCAKGGLLRIIGSHNKGLLSINISNPLDPHVTSTNRPSNHLALDNIRLRLQGLFSMKAQLLISSSDGEFHAQLNIPYQTSLS